MVLDGNAVRSVDRAAALLLALGDSQGEAGVTELARRLGLHKSTASRLLATLQKRGLVEQDDDTGKYRLGLVVIRLAERAERTLDLRGIAMPELERLARLTHETTGLGVVDGDKLLTVAQADGPNLIAVGDWTGRSVPLHCAAPGQVRLPASADAGPGARCPRARARRRGLGPPRWYRRPARPRSSSPGRRPRLTFAAPSRHSAAPASSAPRACETTARGGAGRRSAPQA